MGKKRKTKKRNNPLGGLGKLASFTSDSIGSVSDIKRQLYSQHDKFDLIIKML